MDFGDFDDDLFETNSERKNKDFSESIKSYKAKQIIPKVKRLLFYQNISFRLFLLFKLKYA